MKRQALDNLRAAIEANTEKRSIEQLKAQGKRHVRVVSGDKVMQIIKAIVSDIVDREVGETTQRDRDRIVNETKTQFDRVLKMQGEQDALIQEQKELVAQYRHKLELVVAERDRYKAAVQDGQSEQAEREGRMLAEYQEKVRDLTEKARDAAGQANEMRHTNERLEQLLEDERRKVAARDELQQRLGAESEARSAGLTRIQELEGQLEESRGKWSQATAHGEKAERVVHKQQVRITSLRNRIERLEGDVERLREERDRLAAELVETREKGVESTAVDQLAGELAQMKSFLQHLDERSSTANDATVAALVEQLSERESVNTSSIEDRFNASLDASLDKITRTMEAATAKPIDVVVEATDVLIDKIFDMPDEVMSSNLDELDVEESTTRGNIAGNLERLRQMQGGSPAKNEEEEKPVEEEEDATEAPHVKEALAAALGGEAFDSEPPPPPKADPDEARETDGTTTHDTDGDAKGPDAETAVVSSKERDKISASMERLKAVRDGSESDT